MIQAIIFDCFGVLATDGWLPFKRTYFAHDQQLMQEATDLNKQADAGLLSSEDFVKHIARLAGVSEQAAYQAIRNNVPNEPLFDYMKELKKQYKIGLLSNASGNWLEELFTPEQVALFDATALSYETGFIKPQPEAYQAISQRLGVEPERCVLIDDQIGYADGARSTGMQFIVYSDPDQLRTDLNKLLTDSKQ